MQQLKATYEKSTTTIAKKILRVVSHLAPTGCDGLTMTSLLVSRYALAPEDEKDKLLVLPILKDHFWSSVARRTSSQSERDAYKEYKLVLEEQLRIEEKGSNGKSGYEGEQEGEQGFAAWQHEYFTIFRDSF